MDNTVTRKNNGSVVRFTELNRCPICGGHEGLERGQGVRCTGYYLPDNSCCVCSREEHDGDSTATGRRDSNGGAYHRLTSVPSIKTTNGGSKKTRFVESYDYLDANGALRFQVVRRHLIDANGKDVVDEFTGKPKKDFVQRRKGPDGEWIWNLQGIEPVLYRLPQLLSADHSLPVFVTEGERHADRLASLGFIATSAPMGAGKWRQEYNENLRSRKVFILPDNDQPGMEHAQKVAESLSGIAESIKIVKLPGLPEKGDILEWIAAGGTADKLSRLTENCKEWEPAGAEEETEIPSLDDWPKPIAEEAFHGLAGEFVRLIEPHTESDTAALLVQFLAAFGNVIGRSAHWEIESTKHFMNLFVVLVGRTAGGRKGTSWDVIRSLFDRVDCNWATDCVKSGLSTGEGLKFHVRDRVEKNGEIIDEGVSDKRLLAIESEFANVLKVASREGNTLSTSVRQAWDGSKLVTLTKSDPVTATGAHISIIGHITRDELRTRMNNCEAANGFANRFLWVAVRRSKSLPFGGNLDEGSLSPLIIKLNSAVRFGSELSEIGMTSGAKACWAKVYESLTREIPGTIGLVTSRKEAQVRRLACIYAILDRQRIVDSCHLLAGLAVWEYLENSARYIFGDSTGNATADKILSHLRKNPNGMTRTAIRRECFNGNKDSAEIGSALSLLEQGGIAIKEKEQTEGKPREIWRALRL